jgi:DNA-binding Lrp family transcriptional regulator
MAAKFQYIDNKHMLTFKALPKLTFSEDNKGYIKYGKDNLYPQELVRLFNEHPEHRAIVNRKARYIWGKGIKAVNEIDEIKVNTFIDNFNRKETLNQAGKKVSLNTELFNGVYVEVITNLQGQPIEMYFLNSANCRISECETKLYFSKNWNKNTQAKDIKCINKFENNGTAGTFFIDFKYYTASASKLESVYPIAQYQSIVNDINTDVDISTFNKNYVSSGFSVGKIVNFFNGMPTDEMAHSIERSFKGTFTGENGESLMITHSDRDDKAPEVVDVTVNDLSEKFAFTSKRAMKKIFAGHEMAPELFNIKFDESFLSGSPDLLILQELFVKGYIEPRQNDLLEFLSYLSFLKTGEYLEMMFEPISLIGADLSNDTDLTQDERRKLKGYDALVAVPLDVNGQPLPIVAAITNDNLTGLSAADNADMYRIVRDYSKGKINEHLAVTRLTAYGIDETQAKKILGIEVKMSSEVDNVLMALSQCGRIEDPSTYTVLKRERVKSSNEALKYERQIMKFADALVITIQELDNAVLNALQGNPTMTINEIAELTKTDANRIKESITRLVSRGYLEDTTDGFKPTPKAAEKKAEPIVSDEIYTVYKYEVNEDKPNLLPGGKSRTFCSKLMDMDRVYEFEEIDGIRLKGVGSNISGSNIWDYRGSYYTWPKNSSEPGRIDPDCRHLWMAETRVRKKEKK